MRVRKGLLALFPTLVTEKFKSSQSHKFLFSVIDFQELSNS